MWVAVAATTLGGSGFLMALVLGPVGRAWGNRISGKHPEGPEVAEMQRRIEELEAALDRVAELEERVDFAERVLADPKTQ